MADPGGLDTSWLTGVDLDDVGLSELGQALNAGQGEISIGPEWTIRSN